MKQSYSFPSVPCVIIVIHFIFIQAYINIDIHIGKHIIEHILGITILNKFYLLD